MESMDIGALHANKNLDDIVAVPYKLYWKRWLMLFLYCIYCISSIVHWIQYSVIADVTVKYYSVSYHAVEWTAMVFSGLYILFSIPGTYILDKLGLRISILIGVTGTSVGSWLKVIAVHPNRFWLVLLSQCIIAMFQVFVLPVPPKLAAVWFGSNEVSFACTMAVVAVQVSLALGFIFPPLLVKQGDMETIETGFYKMIYGYAIFSTVVIIVLYFCKYRDEKGRQLQFSDIGQSINFIMTVILRTATYTFHGLELMYTKVFEDAPDTPPSFAQQQVQENKKISFDYKNSLLKVIKNKSFLLLVLIYGIHLGASIAIPVLLNQMLLEYYPDAGEHVGYLGLLVTSSGILGSVIYGVVISKFGGLKFISWFVYVGATITSVLFVFLIDQGLPVVYILGIITGTFWSCIFCVGFELGSELTYPEPEAAAGGILTNSYELFGVVMTYVYSYIYNDVSKLSGNLFLMVILLLADMLLFFIKFDLRRSAVEKSKTSLLI